MALVLAACGGGDSGTSEPVAATEDDTSEPESPGDEDGDADATDACDAITATQASEIYAELAQIEYEERLACIERRAEEEGQVIIYSSRDADMLEAWQADWSELYPNITMEYLSAQPEVLYERLIQEGRGDVATADVVQMGEELKLLGDDGHLATLHGATVPADFPDHAHGDWFMSFGPSPLLLTWNTDLVSADEAPQTWEDLLDPKWKGKVAIDTGATHFVKTLVGRWGEDEARDYLDKLVNDNDAIIRRGHTNITNMLMAGEFPVAAELYGHRTERMIHERGAPLDWIAPDPTPTGSGGFGIAATAPRPYAAALLAHYMTGPRGGQIWAEDGRLHMHPDVEPMFPRVAELIGDERLFAANPDQGHEELEIAQRLINEIIVPAYAGEDGELEEGGSDG
ncbi:ABC transporter substrate-binding protein [Egicoccus sp. AB-alg6-2]|uniref:ABC transporter substrate-binding protein n=1 Tax=Egicoccus sp. AB-alg6-2 TaxID=3242692 RepID=UPI00359DF694